MRLVYQAFPIRHALRDELTWTHYRLISKVDSERARLFYRDEAITSQWSTRQLARQIHSLYYERLLSSQQKKELIAETNDQQPVLTPKDIIRDPYILDFLGLQNMPKLSEKALETALIDKIQLFLLELGKGFAFVARQKRLPTENKDFYIDLVFYNILLKCYVLIDLKIGELDHSDIGQMDMYVRYFEDKIRGTDDNPTVGIILCSEKDEAIVKGNILKMIILSDIGEDRWNLGFGDVTNSGIDDSVITSNFDAAKVMRTVAKVAYEFLETYPDRTIYIEPVDIKRKRFYNTLFQRYAKEIEPFFDIFGLNEKKQREPYSSFKRYNFFEIKIKLNNEN